MTIAYRAGSSNSVAGNDPTPNCPIPASAQAGDVAVFAVQYKNAGTITTPSGWTAQAPSGSASNNTEAVFTKVLAAGDAGTTVSATLGTSIRWAACLAVYSGAASVDAIAGADSGLTTSTTAQVAPPITPVAADCLRVGVGGVRGSTNVSVTFNTTPAGWTLRQQASSSGATTNVACAIYDTQLTGQAGTAQGAATATVSDASAYASHSLTLKPAVVTPPTTTSQRLHRNAGIRRGGARRRITA